MRIAIWESKRRNRKLFRAFTLAMLIGAGWPAPSHSADESLIERMKHADPAGKPIQRRPKFLTDGSYDAADPSAPTEIKDHGEKVWMILFSGGSVIYDQTLEGFLRGGMHHLQDIEFRYADGKSVTTKPYRINAAPWDPDLTTLFSLGKKPRYLGYAGMMERRLDGSEPTRANDNETRTRHVLDVSFWREKLTGNWHQVWKDLGSVQGYKPREFTGHWIGTNHAHGYGSHLMKDANGNPVLFFDEVSEEKNLGAGLLPYKTEIFARALSPDGTHAIGPKIPVLKVAPENHPDKPYRATTRSNGSGFLMEGPHLIEAQAGNTDYYLLFFSAGDAFTDRYGTFYSYRKKSDGLLGPFTPVTDTDGELVDLTHDLTVRLDGTWGVGRMNPFWDHQHRLWGLSHVILKQNIPDNEVKSGWPPTPEQLIHRARQTLLVPLEVSVAPEGTPVVRMPAVTSGARKAIRRGDR